MKQKIFDFLLKILSNRVNKAKQEYNTKQLESKQVESNKEIKPLTLNERLKKYAYDKYGLIVYDLTLFGIRGATYQNGQLVLNKNENDIYNDSLILVNSKSIVNHFECSVDPGQEWIDKPMNPKGTARLEEGLYFYRRGLHKGFPAFVQDSRVRIRRDQNRDGIWQENELVEEGYFGINIHWSYSMAKVSTDSAGCIVIRGNRSSKNWIDFYNYFVNYPKFPVIIVEAKNL
jgi:hypothetical protein